MKKIYYFILVMFFSASFNLSQVQVDSTVIVKDILQKQIEEAKAKQNKSLTKPSEIVVAKVKEIKKPAFKKSLLSLTLNPTLVKTSVISFASILAFGFVAVRRKKLSLLESKKTLKDNIKKIRNEQLVVSIDPRLKNFRKKLVMNSSYLKSSDDKLKFVRKNQIAESELMLALKLKEYQTEVAERGGL